MREAKREAKERQRAQAAWRKDVEKHLRAAAGKPPRGQLARAWLKIVALSTIPVVSTGLAIIFVQDHSGGSSQARTTASPDGTRSPSSAPASEPAPPGSLYAGTPAATWPVGKAGISIPAVTSTTAYIPEHAAAMRTFVKKYLVTALLDRRVVLQGDMGPFLRAMGPEPASRWTEWLSTKSERATGNALAWDSLVNRFHPGDWTQVEEPRVKGRTRVSYSSDNCVVFTWSYAVAYGFAPSTGGPARPVVVRRDGTITACSDLFTKGPGTVLVSSGGYTSLDSVCGADWPYVGFINAWPDPSRAVVTSPSPVETAWDPTEVDSASPNTCFHDTSGFHRP